MTPTELAGWFQSVGFFPGKMSDIELLLKVRIGDSFPGFLLILALLAVKPGASCVLHQLSGREDTLPALPFNTFSLNLCELISCLSFMLFIIFSAVPTCILLLLMLSRTWFSISPSFLISNTVLLFLPVSFKMYVCMYVSGEVWWCNHMSVQVCALVRRPLQDVWCLSLSLSSLLPWAKHLHWT